MSHHDFSYFQKRYKTTVFSLTSPNINRFWILKLYCIQAEHCYLIIAFNDTLGDMLNVEALKTSLSWCDSDDKELPPNCIEIETSLPQVFFTNIDPKPFQNNDKNHVIFEK